MNTPSLPTKLTKIGDSFVYVPQTGLTGVPSGYARQAQFEAIAKFSAFKGL